MSQRASIINVHFLRGPAEVSVPFRDAGATVDFNCRRLLQREMLNSSANFWRIGHALRRRRAHE